MLLNIFKKSLFILSFKILGTIAAFIFTSEVTKKLGASESGLFFFFSSFVILSATIARFGTDNTIVKFYDKKSSFYFQQLKLLFFLSVICTLLFYLFLVSSSGLFIEQLSGFFMISCFFISVLATSVITSFSFFYQAQQKYIKSILMANVIFNFIFALILFFIEIVDATQIITLFAALNLILFFIVMVVFNNKLFISRRSPFPPGYLVSSFSLWLNTIQNQVLANYPILFGVIWLTEAQISFLGVSNRISLLISFALLAVNFVLAPKLRALLKDNLVQESRVLVRKITWLSISVSSFVVFLSVNYSEFILSFFGNEFVNAQDVLLYFLLAQWLNASSGPVALLLIFSEKEKMVLFSTTLSLICVILLFPILVSSYGVVGASVAVFLSSLVRNLLLVFMVKIVHGYWIFL